MPNIKHAFTNPKADGGDATIVRPSNWNAEHVLDQYLDYPAVADPAAPAAGNLRVYAKDIAGRVLPKFVGPSGVDFPVQDHLAFSQNSCLFPGGGTTLDAIGCTITNVGTISNPTIASTNFKTQVRRALNTSAGTAGALSSTRVTNLECWRGNVAGQGGFFMVARFSIDTLAAGMRAFVGLWDSVAAATNIDPTTDTTRIKVGMAINANTGNWNLIHNASAAAPTVIALGANFPVNTTDLYELTLYCSPNSSTRGYRVRNMSTGNETSGTLSTNLPAATVFLARVIWATNNATAAAVAWSLSRFYLGSDT